MKGQSLLVKKEPCHNEKALEADRCDSIVNTKDISPSNTQNNMCYQTSLRQPTIILAANPHIDSSNMKHDSNVFSNINIKVEPAESITSSPPSSPEHHGTFQYFVLSFAFWHIHPITERDNYCISVTLLVTAVSVDYLERSSVNTFSCWFCAGIIWCQCFRLLW